MVSIVIPVYNCEQYIEKCVASVLNQTCKNFELIIVNDASTDQTLKILKQLSISDKRINIINNRCQQGVSASRNIGLKAAEGEYLLFIDADDYVADNMLEILVNTMKNNQSDVVVCNHYEIYGNEKILRDTAIAQGNYQKAIKKTFLAKYYERNNAGLFSSCNKMYSVKFIKDNNLWFDEERKRAEDYWFNVYVYIHAKSITVIKDALYYYVRNSASAMSRYRKDDYEKFVKTRKTLLQIRDEHLPNYVIDYDSFDYSFIINTISYMINILKNENKINAKIKIIDIMKDATFREAIKHNKLLSFNVKTVTCLIKYKLYTMAYILLVIRRF